MKNQALFKVAVATIFALIAGLLTTPTTTLVGVPLVEIYELIGGLFLNALTLVVVPLIASSIIVGTSRVGGDRAFARLGKRTLIAFIGSGLVAVLIGMTLTLVLRPGAGIVSSSADISAVSHPDTLAAAASHAEGRIFDRISDLLYRIVPSNILAVASSGQMLGLICFSLLFGVFTSRIDSELSDVMQKFWKALFQVMMCMTDLVMRALPLGVFGLMAKVVATTGFDKVSSIIWFVVTDLLGMLILVFIAYPLALKIFTKRSPLQHARDVVPAIVTAFSTSSTAATLPVTIDCMEQRAKVPNTVCSFTLPLGTSLNLTGTALHSVTAVLFITQVSGAAITLPLLITVLLMGLFTSLGMVAGVPSGSLVTILVILQTIGIPTEEIALILLVERLLDMCRTTVSVFGNTCCALFVAR